jgi:uncharacterized protein YjiS (DUF1127 family)
VFAPHPGIREGETAMLALLSALPAARDLPRLRLPLPPLRRWWRIRRERQQLLEMSDHMLQDVGLTREQVLQEAARPFWDVQPR